MKRTLFASLFLAAIMLLIVVPPEAPAQARPWTKVTISPAGQTYAASQTDTLKEDGVWAGYGLVSLVTVTTDSTNLITNVEYRATTAASWAIVHRDTVTSTVAAGVKREIVLRSPTVDRIGGNSGQIRVEQIWNASGNGVTTPNTYTDIYVR